MPLTMYRASVPTVLRQLDALLGVLNIAEDHAVRRAIEPGKLLTMRLFPDMLTAAEQVQAVSLLSVRGLAWLAGEKPLVFAPFDQHEGFAALYARLDRSVNFIKALAPAQINGSEERIITVVANSGVATRYTGEAYLFNYYLPNLFFHVTVAYSVFRHAGVEIGKRHYLGIQPILD